SLSLILSFGSVEFGCSPKQGDFLCGFPCRLGILHEHVGQVFPIRVRFVLRAQTAPDIAVGGVTPESSLERCRRLGTFSELLVEFCQLHPARDRLRRRKYWHEPRQV